MDDDVSLGEARAWLRARVEKGAECPCCTQFAKVYRRTITSGAGKALIILHKRANGWIHVPSVPWLSNNGGEVARLRFWGLVEEELERREDGGRAGWWRVTDKGAQFAMDQITVPKYARIDDDRLLQLLGDEWSIRDALRKKFNYEELMRGE